MMALDKMIAEPEPPFVHRVGGRLLDATLAADLLGRYHILLEAREKGWEPPTLEASEISDEALPPEKAIDFFLKKQIMLKTDFDALADEYRPLAFTIAKMEQIELLESAKGLLSEFIRDDRGLEEFRTELGTMFDRAGVTQLNPWHVELVYRNNMQTAYNAGRWEELMDPEIADFFPIFEYHNPRDERSRLTHAAMSGKRFRRDDPIWLEWWPPSGHHCRCTVLPVSAAEAQDIIPDEVPLTTEDDDGNLIPVVPDPGWAHNPGTATGKVALQGQVRDRASNLGIVSRPSPEGMVIERIV